MEDPNDPCCQIPTCPANATLTNVPVPSYGPGITGYGTATYPPMTVTGNTGPSINGTGTPSSFTGFGQVGPTVQGSTSEFMLIVLIGFFFKSVRIIHASIQYFCVWKWFVDIFIYNLFYSKFHVKLVLSVVKTYQREKSACFRWINSFNLLFIIKTLLKLKKKN